MTEFNKEWAEIVSALVKKSPEYAELLKDSTAVMLENDEIYAYTPHLFPDDNDEIYDELVQPIANVAEGLGYGNDMYCYEETLEEYRESIKGVTVRKAMLDGLTDSNSNESDDSVDFQAYRMADVMMSIVPVVVHAEASYVRGYNPPDQPNMVPFILKRPEGREPNIDDIISFGYTADSGIFDHAIVHTQITNFLSFYLDQPAYDMDIDYPEFASWSDAGYVIKKWNEFIADCIENRNSQSKQQQVGE